jgi:hypothetical protein
LEVASLATVCASSLASWQPSTHGPSGASGSNSWDLRGKSSNHWRFSWENHLSIEVLEWENMGEDGKRIDTMEVSLGWEIHLEMLEFMGKRISINRGFKWDNPQRMVEIPARLQSDCDNPQENLGSIWQYRPRTHHQRINFEHCSCGL